MAFTYQDMGCAFYESISVFAVIAGWIAEMLYMLFFTNIAEYEAYWLMCVPIIII